jgi:hypothetical protein
VKAAAAMRTLGGRFSPDSSSPQRSGGSLPLPRRYYGQKSKHLSLKKREIEVPF